MGYPIYIKKTVNRRMTLIFGKKTKEAASVCLWKLPVYISGEKLFLRYFFLQRIRYISIFLTFAVMLYLLIMNGIIFFKQLKNRVSNFLDWSNKLKKIISKNVDKVKFTFTCSSHSRFFSLRIQSFQPLLYVKSKYNTFRSVITV